MTKHSKLRILRQQIAYDIRQGIIYQWKKYAMLLIVYIVCIVSFIIRCKTNRHIESYTCGDMVMWMLKGMKKIETGRHMNIDIPSVYIFPNVIIAFIVGNYVIKDLYGYGKSVLLKAGSRINWWRCAPLLVLLTYSLLPCCIHACINGYYYGRKNAFVPSLCQLIEQIARVGSVWIIFQITTEKGIPLTAFHAVCGLVIGECFGLLVSMSALLREKRLPRGSYTSDSICNSTMTHAFLAMVIPLTINRLSVAFSTSLENLLIPQKLQLYGYTQTDALSIYGILSGMTLSIILFPCVLTNSLSVLLLPAISEARGRSNENQIRRTTKEAIQLGLLLGFAFTILFLLTGDMIGNKLFHNALAGHFICRLAWLCPLMYITSLLNSILHGLGRPKQVLFVNLLACLIRIGMIWFLVPAYGIGAYLWGLLLSQVFASVACMWLLREFL